ncbi:MAG: CDP-alcohol phosphatidyltransferase family protein [Woeseia sp.]
MAGSLRHFRHIPNVISVARIIATPILIYFALGGRENAYTWLLLAALLSDIVDGLIARRFSFTSELGSRLDTMADTLLWVAAVAGIWKFHPELVMDYGILVVLVLFMWVVHHIAELLRYGKLASFHTYSMRASAYALGIFLISMFVWGIRPWLLYVASALSVLASVEQLILVALLPEWTPNVRGFYWALRMRKVGAM